MELDTNLYSRQIPMYGIETMQKISNLKIFIYGMKGLGVEIAKNLILTGPKMVTIYDNTFVSFTDLGSNYLLTESDVQKSTRADASLQKLRKLNESVIVNDYKEELANNFNVLKDYQVVIISEIIARDMAEALNMFCRENKIGFIYCACLGVSGFSFTDFGDDFIIKDANGEDNEVYYVKSITKQNPGLVTIDDSVDGRKLNLSHGDFVTFREIAGMSELNESPPRPVRVSNSTSFTIEDTSKFCDYISGGVVEQVKIPIPTNYRSLKECFENIFFEQNDYSTLMNNDNTMECRKSLFSNYPPYISQSYSSTNRKELLHLIVLALHEFFGMKNRLPYINNKEDSSEIIDISKRIYFMAKERKRDWALGISEIEEKVISQIARTTRAKVPPVCSFLGGIISQEVIKITSKFTPFNQWYYFDFLECLEGLDQAKTNFDAEKSDRYHDQISIFGRDIQEKLSKLNIFIIGCGALGNEYLKNFTLMGISTQSEGKLTIADFDKVELPNLNRQFMFDKNCVGKNKAACSKEFLININTDTKCEDFNLKVNEESENVITDEFLSKQNFIFTAVDNIETREYIDRRCTLLGKTLIDSGTYGTQAHCQVIIPNITSCYSDMDDRLYIQNNRKSCALTDFPNLTEDCIEWGKELFEEYFNKDAKELNNMVNDYTKNNNILAEKLKNELIKDKEKLQNLKRIIEIAVSQDFNSCIESAIDKFSDLFEDKIKKLLSKYPPDEMNDDGSIFWTGARRCPDPITLNLDDNNHFEFIMSYSVLLARMMKIKNKKDKNYIKAYAERVKSRGKSFTLNDSSNSKYDGKQSFSLVEEILESLNICKTNSIKFDEINFEKDDDDNDHIKFINSAGNLRAGNYKIKESDFLKTKIIAGRIIPAVASTTASIAGLASIQIYSLLINNWAKNSYINLGINTSLITEPFSKIVHKDKYVNNILTMKALPQEWSVWDKIEINGPMTFKEFIAYVLEEYSVKVERITIEYKKELLLIDDNIADCIIEEYAIDQKIVSKLNRNYLILEIHGVTDKERNDKIEVEVKFPRIKYNFPTHNNLI